MTKEMQAAVFLLAAKHISSEEFVKTYPPESASGYDIDRLLEHAIVVRDGDAVEAILTLAAIFQAMVSPSRLEELLPGDWHEQHEEVARSLQKARDPNTVAALRAAALAHHDYLEQVDEFFGLARICTWALADIGTEDARQALESIAGCGNELIAQYAKKRLRHWQRELDRKGHKGSH